MQQALYSLLHTRKSMQIGNDLLLTLSLHLEEFIFRIEWQAATQRRRIRGKQKTVAQSHFQILCLNPKLHLKSKKKKKFKIKLYHQLDCSFVVPAFHRIFSTLYELKAPWYVDYLYKSPKQHVCSTQQQSLLGRRYCPYSAPSESGLSLAC